jgi:uncharacterized cupredoxin-like copper-binding protein
MHKKRLSMALGVFGVCALGLMAWFFGVATDSAAGKTATHAAAKVTVITVTAGKPTELAFKLSRFSALPKGTITFKVKNLGFAFHDFKICTTPVSTAARNTCVGKATKILKDGQTATLTVILEKNGKYEYLCAVPGHAAAGMKGLIGVGVKMTPSASVAANSSSSTSSTAPAPAPAPGNANADECPPGMTIAAAGATDGDGDDNGGPTDGDGCV